MPTMTVPNAEALQPAQAVELCRLVEAEACWENLRRMPSPDPNLKALRADLLDRQRAYESFHGKLTAYNKTYRPAHVPELLLNNPVRLGTWCRKMRDLCRVAGQEPKCPCPASLVEKAYWWADRISRRLNAAPAGRTLPPASMEAAIGELEALGQWCDALGGVPGAAQAPLVPA